jgi:hypothetical protein
MRYPNAPGVPTSDGCDPFTGAATRSLGCDPFTGGCDPLLGRVHVATRSLMLGVYNVAANTMRPAGLADRIAGC